MRIRIVVAVAALGLSGCEQAPKLYPLPQQEPQFVGFKPHSVRVLNMADADAPAFFVRDIQPDLHVSWRWGMQRPAVRVRVHAIENLKYTIDFTLPQVTFQDTGPVTIAFSVNDHLLERVRYEHSGSYHFEKEVPPEWVKGESDAIVGAEIDKMWTSKLDGARFGFIISRMGLTQ